jgi:hypothetical protein
MLLTDFCNRPSSRAPVDRRVLELSSLARWGPWKGTPGLTTHRGLLTAPGFLAKARPRVVECLTALSQLRPCLTALLPLGRCADASCVAGPRRCRPCAQLETRPLTPSVAPRPARKPRKVRGTPTITGEGDDRPTDAFASIGKDRFLRELVKARGIPGPGRLPSTSAPRKPGFRRAIL